MKKKKKKKKKKTKEKKEKEKERGEYDGNCLQSEHYTTHENY